MAYYLDYSAAELSGTIIKNAGYTGAIRYIDSPANLGRKHTSLAEYRSLKAAGLDVRLVMQTTTTASDGGRAAGIDHAQRALAGAKYLGYTGVIYFTNDRVNLPSSTSWDAYLTGVASVLGWARVGAYGFANAMDVAAHMTECQHFWQAGRRSDVRPFVQIWQDNNVQVTVGGITCDRNLILKQLVEDVMDARQEAILAYVKAVVVENQTRINTANASVDTLEPKVAALTNKVDALIAQVAALQGGGGVVDVVALAKAVNDDAARRLAE